MVVMTGAGHYSRRVLFLSQSLSSSLPNPPLQYLQYNLLCFNLVNVHFDKQFYRYDEIN